MHPFHLHTNACNSSTRKELIPKKQKTASFLMPLFYKQTLSKLWNVEKCSWQRKGDQTPLVLSLSFKSCILPYLEFFYTLNKYIINILIFEVHLVFLKGSHILSYSNEASRDCKPITETQYFQAFITFGDVSLKITQYT